VLHAAGLLPYPSFVNSGDNAWQLTAATLVGLMSLPGIAVLYGGLVQKKWAVNTMLMAFSAFAAVLVVWVLWAYNMGFGHAWLGHLLGRPATITGASAEQGRAGIPSLGSALPGLRMPTSTLAYFQFVFAAITPLLFLGSVLGRMSFKAWLIFVPAWTTFAYTVNAFLLWGGGFWAAHGALDYSGGYVIHLAAGTTGFVAAMVIGPRLRRDREHGTPNNLLMCAAGAGILWLGWNGFNGGDPYFAGSDAGVAVLNTNLATAVALLAWLVLDMTASRQKKPTFLGSVNGMIVGLVAITPAAGFVNGVGAIVIGLVSSVIVWTSWNHLGRTRLFRRVDDALGVVHTHGIAGLTGGLLVGVLADPHVHIYPGVSSAGLIYGHPWQVVVQLGAAGTIVAWDALVTVVLLKVIGRFVALRHPDPVLATGDLAIHDEELYPPEILTTRSGRATAVRVPPEPVPARTAAGDDGA
jgi:Amt family ammonium transporter